MGPTSPHFSINIIPHAIIFRTPPFFLHQKEIVSYSSRKLELPITIILAIVLAGTLPETVSGQNCSCTPISKTVTDIVTEDFYNCNVPKATATCVGKGFYSRAAFLEAASCFPRFGTDGSRDDIKREIAAFFAQFERETGHFCYIDEIVGASRNYCNKNSNNSQYPCASGKLYFGRGPAQLKWNFHYGAAGNIICFDGLKNPEILSKDNVISLKAALWFWMNNCHNPMILGQGFVVTSQAFIAMARYHPRDEEYRASLYKKYCKQLQVDPGKIYTAAM